MKIKRHTTAAFGLSLLAMLALLGLGHASPEAVAAQAVAPSNSSPPTISGTAEEGRVLTAGTGSWRGSTPMTFTYQWQRCASTDLDTCVAIAGGNGQTYTLGSADVGRRIRVLVTARNNDGSATATSAQTSAVRAAPRDAPRNTAAPSISGDAEEGKTLTVSNGTWTGTAPITFSYQWLRCNSDGGACAPISGATSRTYRLTGAEVGRRVRATVTATNSVGAASVTSGRSSIVDPAAAAAPRNTAAPSLSGTGAQEGVTLTASPGQWSGTATIRFAFAWQRCDARSLACANISGATAETYTLTSADVGNTVRVVVTATNSAGSSSVPSPATSVVAPKAPPAPSGTIKLPSGQNSIPASSVALPSRLIIDGVRFSPNPVRSRGGAVTARVHVSDTKGNVVREARVQLIGLPYNWATGSPEVSTGVDGWATIVFRTTSAIPSRGALVVFLRARKLGDNLLAGVSTRRLVQVRIAIG